MISILELYPEHLAVNGDMGNVLVLEKRLELAGIASRRLAHNPGDALPEKPDIVTIGTGPASALQVLADDIARIAPTLRSWVDDGMPLLAVTGGMQLLGSAITLPGGAGVTGAGVFGIHTDATQPRVVTNCFVVDTILGRLVGIENHGSRTTLTDGTAPFGTVSTGTGNDSRSEGVWVNNAIGTHVQGPVLAMNPVLADHLISIATKRAGLSYATTAEHDTIDALAAEARRLLGPAPQDG
ncbi:type 1 glutamine amidotransferase [Marisediminicola senii]|uniref:type 1 glutamine amidotransferase n=1 Tax=Marisediminicola senii TaxID=2711233 RepID=UPI0013ECEC2F|nr:hypothetical protein [Marisediminicola senii]